MTIEAKRSAGEHRPHGSGSAWSAAARAPSSAACIASPRGSTITTSSSPARSSSSAEKSRRSGLALGLAEDRCYADYAAMAKAEAARGDGIEAVAIVTPNHLHAPVAEAFLKAGIHVICDKPLATTREGSAPPRDARREAAAASSPSPTTTPATRWCGRPGSVVQDGRARRDPRGPGRVRAGLADRDRSKPPARSRPSWRTDPARSGAGGCVGDIGTHAYQLAGFVAGLEVERALRRAQHASSPAAGSTTTCRCCCASATARAACSGRARSRRATRTTCACASTAAAAGLEWRQEQPNQLHWSPFGEPTQTISRAHRRCRGRRGAGVAHSGRPSRGLPRGFATLYGEIAAGDPRRAPGRAEAGPGGAVSRARRRPPRRRVHRGRGRLFRPRRSLGPARPLGPVALH